MRVLIVDDEPIARQVLRELLEDLPGIEPAGEAASGAEALALVERARPDVLLLDVQMPGLDGIELARRLRPGLLVVYVTAHVAHAVDAFDAGAADYLLKPVRPERLQAALERARQRLSAQPAPPAAPRWLTGRSGADLVPVNVDDIIAFQAAGDFCWIITASARLECPHPLKELESRFPAPRFRRIHRSTIINTDHIRRISPLSSKRWLVRLSNGQEVTVSKRQAGLIRGAMAW
jgi:DNA-binding LytR/AlgR family response regulator